MSERCLTLMKNSSNVSADAEMNNYMNDEIYNCMNIMINEIKDRIIDE